MLADFFVLKNKEGKNRFCSGSLNGPLSGLCSHSKGPWMAVLPHHLSVSAEARSAW